MSYWQESTFHIRVADLKPLAFLVFIKNRRFYIHYIFSKTISLTCFNNFNKTDREKWMKKYLHILTRHKILYWKYISSISRFIYVIKFPVNVKLSKYLPSVKLDIININIIISLILLIMINNRNRQGTLQSNAIFVKILFTFLFTLSVSWLNETSQPNILTKIFLWAYWNCAYYMLNILNVLNIYRYILLCKQKW